MHVLINDLLCINFQSTLTLSVFDILQGKVVTF